MDKKVKCPWCLQIAVPKMQMMKKENGMVKERRCSECGKVLAAYLDGEGDFLKAIRKFEN